MKEFFLLIMAKAWSCGHVILPNDITISFTQERNYLCTSFIVPEPASFNKMHAVLISSIWLAWKKRIDWGRQQKK